MFMGRVFCFGCWEGDGCGGETPPPQPTGCRRYGLRGEGCGQKEFARIGSQIPSLSHKTRQGRGTLSSRCISANWLCSSLLLRRTDGRGNKRGRLLLPRLSTGAEGSMCIRRVVRGCPWGDW